MVVTKEIGTYEVLMISGHPRPGIQGPVGSGTRGRRKRPCQGFLKKAIDVYLTGFEADWRDAYPSVNAVTLMELQDPPDPRREQLVPIIHYAVERKIAAGKLDYRD